LVIFLLLDIGVELKAVNTSIYVSAGGIILLSHKNDTLTHIVTNLLYCVVK